MSKDIQGLGLGLASRFAGSELAKKYGLRKPAERIAYLWTKKGFQFVGKLQADKAKKKAADPLLLAAPAAHGLFDLTLTDEQQMIKDTVRSYAEEVVRGLAHDANEAMTLPENYLEDIQALGLNFFSVPEVLGGAAQSYSPTTSAIIAEELAWGDMSLAFATLAPVGVALSLIHI